MTQNETTTEILQNLEVLMSAERERIIPELSNLFMKLDGRTEKDDFLASSFALAAAGLVKDDCSPEAMLAIMLLSGCANDFATEGPSIMGLPTSRGVQNVARKFILGRKPFEKTKFLFYIQNKSRIDSAKNADSYEKALTGLSQLVEDLNINKLSTSDVAFLRKTLTQWGNRLQGPDNGTSYEH